MKDKFTINDIHIKNVSTNKLKGDNQGVTHQKILTTLSVVQAIKGSYSVSINNGSEFSTGEKGVFVAPSSAVQKITHYNGKDGEMQAHWVFIDATVNGEFKFDEIFTFPVILNAKYNNAIFNLINKIDTSTNYFEKITSAYKILEILYNEGEKAVKPNPVKVKIENFVKNNYYANLQATDIAREVFCSTAQIYRVIKKHFGVTPANYVNGIRLQQAGNLLITTNKTVAEIAVEVGFNDTAYFSKLFKKDNAVTPTHYREIYSV